MTMIPEKVPAQVVVVVRGGCVVDVAADIPIQYTLVDWDNIITAGDERPDLPEGFAYGADDEVIISGPTVIAKCPQCGNEAVFARGQSVCEDCAPEPEDRLTLTVQQVVESAYGWAANNERDGEIVPVEDLTSEYDRGDMGDGLIETILRETMDWRDSGGPENGPEHWEMAIRRMQNMVRDCETVLEALYRYCGNCADRMIEAEEADDE